MRFLFLFAFRHLIEVWSKFANSSLKAVA